MTTVWPDMLFMGLSYATPLALQPELETDLVAVDATASELRCALVGELAARGGAHHTPPLVVPENCAPFWPSVTCPRLGTMEPPLGC